MSKKSVFFSTLAACVFLWWVGVGALFLFQQIFINPFLQEVDYSLRDLTEETVRPPTGTTVELAGLELTLPAGVTVRDVKARSLDDDPYLKTGASARYEELGGFRGQIFAYRSSDEIGDRSSPVLMIGWLTELLFPEVNSSYRFLEKIHSAKNDDFSGWNLVHDCRYTYLMLMKVLMAPPLRIEGVFSVENQDFTGVMMVGTGNHDGRRYHLITFAHGEDLYDISIVGGNGTDFTGTLASVRLR